MTTSQAQVPEKPSREAWAVGYAAQARSDWEIFKLLIRTKGVESCHRLHYLQMACEKIAKAHRCRDTEADLDDLLTKHVGIESFVAGYMASPRVAAKHVKNSRQLKAVTNEMRQIAREIETLAPAVDKARTPTNAEYPWANGAAIVVPCQYENGFSELLARIRSGVLQVFEQAISEF